MKKIKKMFFAFRSAITGKFVSKKFASKNSGTTIKQKMKK